MRIRPFILLLALSACTQPKEGSHHGDSGPAGDEGGTGGGAAGGAGGAAGATGGTGGATGGMSGGGAGGTTGGAGGAGGSDASVDVGPAPQCTSNAGCGPCQECVSGACRNQAAGQDQKNDCDGTDPLACRTGDCDGSGACQKVTGNRCSGADLIVCNGGTGMRQSCPSGQCTSNQCTGCGALNQACCNGTCNAGYTCKAGTCVAACVPGGTCGTNDMCKKSQISCDTGSPVCVSIAINEGITCSAKRCKGTTDVVEGRCSGGVCAETTVQNCGSTRTCTANQCKKKNGQPCASSSECANNNCNGPRFCVGGTNDHCPCTDKVDEMCESGPSACKVDQTMKTCGGGDCTNWSCVNATPPANTCDIHD